MTLVRALHRLLLASVAAMVCPAPASAQAASVADTYPRWTMGPYVGWSQDSVVGTHWGVTPDRKHLMLGLHTTITLRGGRRWSFSYAPEIIPVLILSDNPTYLVESYENGHAVVVREVGTAPVAGVGFSPIALETSAQIVRRVRAYAAGALGGIWFTRQTPVLNSRSFNFTGDYGWGVLWQVSPRTWLRTGYKFHHLSNAKTAPQNPGVDAHMFLVGVERSFGQGSVW